MPSEFLHSGATTKAMPLAKRSRSVEDDGRSEVEEIGQESAAEEHIEDKTTLKFFFKLDKNTLCSPLLPPVHIPCSFLIQYNETRISMSITNCISKSIENHY